MVKNRFRLADDRVGAERRGADRVGADRRGADRRGADREGVDRRDDRGVERWTERGAERWTEREALPRLLEEPRRWASTSGMRVPSRMSRMGRMRVQAIMGVSSGLPHARRVPKVSMTQRALRC